MYAGICFACRFSHTGDQRDAAAVRSRSGNFADAPANRGRSRGRTKRKKKEIGRSYCVLVIVASRVVFYQLRDTTEQTRYTLYPKNYDDHLQPKPNLFRAADARFSCITLAEIRKSSILINHATTSCSPEFVECLLEKHTTTLRPHRLVTECVDEFTRLQDGSSTFSSTCPRIQPNFLMRGFAVSVVC